MPTTTHPTVQCEHCGQTLTLTGEQLQQLEELPAGSRQADRAAICDGWIVFIGSPGVKDFALCPTALDEPTTDIPCPAWCTEQPGHGFHDGRRFHSRDLRYNDRPNVTGITASEQLIDGKPALDQPRIFLADHDDELTADDADQLAELLQDAAAHLRTITGQPRPSIADALPGHVR